VPRAGRELIGFPRHLSQHVGGFVIARGRCTAGAGRERRHARAHRDPVGQGRPRRLGLLKVDVLALGMLSAIRRALASSGGFRGRRPTPLADIPAEDPPPTR
jgi:error-prone DNA polymerase